jgi:hypothetical protein
MAEHKAVDIVAVMAAAAALEGLVLAFVGLVAVATATFHGQERDDRDGPPELGPERRRIAAKVGVLSAFPV